MLGFMHLSAKSNCGIFAALYIAFGKVLQISYKNKKSSAVIKVEKYYLAFIIINLV